MRLTSIITALGVCLSAAVLAACGSDDDNEGTPDSGGGDGGSSGSGGSAGGGTGGTSGSGGTAGAGGTAGSGGTAGAGGTAGTGGTPADAAPPPADGQAPADAGDACAQLATCCAGQLFEQACENISQAGDLAVCEAAEANLCGGGMPVPDAAMMADAAGGPGTGGCAALSACCDALMGVRQDQCNTIADADNDMNCNAVQFAFCD